MLFFVFKAQSELALGNIKFDTKPLSVDECKYNFTTTISNVTETVLNEMPREKQIFDLSYLYYAGFGSLIVLVAALLLSFVFGFQDASHVDQRCLVPFLRKYIRSSSKVTYKDASEKEAVVHKFEMNETNNVME